MPRKQAYFWRQIRSMETQNISYFSLFSIWYCFGIINPYREYWMPLQWEKSMFGSDSTTPSPGSIQTNGQRTSRGVPKVENSQERLSTRDSSRPDQSHRSSERSSIWKNSSKKAMTGTGGKQAGNRKNTQYFDKINEIIGKKDLVTLKHIVSTGNPTTKSRWWREQQTWKLQRGKRSRRQWRYKSKGQCCKTHKKREKIKKERSQASA